MVVLMVALLGARGIVRSCSGEGARNSSVTGSNGALPAGDHSPAIVRIFTLANNDLPLQQFLIANGDRGGQL